MIDQHRSSDTLGTASLLPPPHIVRVDQKKQFSSESLPTPALNHLASVFKSIPWYRDRWSHNKFRQALLQSLKTDAPGGLILLGPGLRFETPPPFTELFEPIQLGTADDRLKTLSGEVPTREERINRVVIRVFTAFGVVLFGCIVLALMRGMSQYLLIRLIAVAAGAGLLAFTIRAIVRWRSTWYLLPAAVAIVSHRRNRPLTLVTRFDACAIIRYVHTGKTVIRMLELISQAGKRRSTPVSEREAASFLAAWQSPHSPPKADQLNELPA